MEELAFFFLFFCLHFFGKKRKNFKKNKIQEENLTMSTFVSYMSKK